MKQRKIFVAIFILGLIYILLPQPTTIDNFPPVPNSTKSTNPFDYQYPNEVAFFSYLWRANVTSFYRDNFRRLHLILGIIPPITINHQIEEARQIIQNEPHSTYFEQYVYPLKDSVYVSGFEPYDQNGHAFTPDIRPVILRDTIYFNSQINVRFFPTPLYARILIYLGIWGSAILLCKLFREVLRESDA